jgi:cyclomaltodextrinase
MCSMKVTSKARTLALLLTILLSNSEIMKSQSPQWAKEAIWYQIFPERFRNGDLSNDPKLHDLAYADPQELPNAWQIHPWSSDWYKLQDWELKNGEPELWKHLLRRRYGGDIQGIIDKLDYLQDLGINAIYLNPIFQSPSLHKYDGESYHHVDPNFGPDPDGDRKLISQENPIDPSTWLWTSADQLVLQLIEEVHSRGMRIIFDGVFNHMSHNSFAFADVRKKQETSVYKDWFNIKNWDNPSTSKNEFDYKAWFGVKSLPEFKEDENGIVKGPRDYIFAATQRWMNPKNKGTQYGVDGWRLDVAFCVKHNFWKSWRKLVKEINPEAYLTAELVSPLEETMAYLMGDEFDAEMNYNWSFTCTEFFFNKGTDHITASAFQAELARMRNSFPPEVAYLNQNLFGSHDVNRLASHIVNRGIGNFRDWGSYFNLSKATDNPKYAVRAANTKEKELQKLFIAMQMCYVGAPMIYYGDEVGMWGANDPDNRKPMLWDDIVYEDEIYLPNQQKRSKPDPVKPDWQLWDFYQEMITIRKNNPALNLGEYHNLVSDDEREIFGFMRIYQDQEIWVIFNNDDEKHELQLSSKKTHLHSLRAESPDFQSTNGSFRIELKAKSFLILQTS